MGKPINTNIKWIKSESIKLKRPYPGHSAGDPAHYIAHADNHLGSFTRNRQESYGF
jgi:hypothetical protein